MYSSLRTRKKTAEDIIHMMGGLKDEIKRLDLKSSNVDTRIAMLSDDINTRFDQLFKALNFAPAVGPPITGTPSPHLSRGKTMRPGSALDRGPAAARNMSIENFANFQKHDAALSRQRSSSGDSIGRPLSAGNARPQLLRTGTSNSSNGSNSRPVSAQKGRRMSGGKEIVRVGFF